MPPHVRTLLGQLRRLASPPESDAALLARWAEGRDEAAFAALVDRHGPMVLGLCRRVLGDADAADDAFQATFLVLARKAARVRRPEALPSFLYGVALRMARKARRRSLPTRPDLPEPADPRPDPLDTLSGRELLAILDDEIARLPHVYRAPLLLCVLQERSVEEAARLLGWSAGSLRGRLARGRERLRQRLTRLGLAPSVGIVALLAPVTISERLRAECVRNLSAPSPVVRALAAPASSVKMKAIYLGLLVVAAGLGAGLPLLRAPQPEAPAAAAPPAPAPKDEPRRDGQGDPLPPGAVVRLGSQRFRAPGELRALALAPDGKSIAVTSTGGVFLFETARGKRVRRLPTTKTAWGTESPLVFSPDGKRLAGRGEAEGADHRYKGVVRVWDTSGNEKPRDYDAERAVWIGWSAGGEPLAVCLEKGGLRLHELAAGRSRRFGCDGLPRPELSHYLGCACTPVGATLAVMEEQRRTLHVWDTATGRERRSWRSETTLLPVLALSPDGRKLAGISLDGDRRAARLWDTATGELLHTLATDQKSLSTVAFSPDGKTLATAGWSDLVFWDVAAGRERTRTRGEGAGSEVVAFSADGRTLATAERHSGAFHLWDVATGARRPEPVSHRNRPHGTFSPDGRRLASSGGLDGTIILWDAATGDSLAHIHRGQSARDVVFSPDARSLFSTWTDDALWVSDAATGGRLHTIKLEDPERPDTYQSALSMYLADDGRTLTTFGSYYPRKSGGGPRHDETLITGWDVATRKQVFRRRRPGMDPWIALSPDARVLAAAHPSRSGNVPLPAPGLGPMRLEDVRTGELLLTFPARERQIWPLAFSPDGRLLASNNSDYQRKGKEGDPLGATGSAFRVWETATAAEVLALPSSGQYRVAFSPDGRVLAMTAPEQEILVWDLPRGRELCRFKGFDAEVVGLNFSPDGRRLVSGLSDSTLLVWDVGPYPVSSGKLGPEDVAKAWADLASADAPRAFRARGTLASAPREAVTLLKEHLRPARPPDAQRLRRLLTDLESDEFAVREKAQAGLEEIGDLAEPALKKALDEKPSLEMRRRVQAVLEHLRGPVMRPEVLRALRAVAVLEDAGTPAARRLLAELAAGAPEARLTREAKASLGRLERRSH